MVDPAGWGGRTVTVITCGVAGATVGVTAVVERSPLSYRELSVIIPANTPIDIANGLRGSIHFHSFHVIPSTLDRLSEIAGS